METSTDAMLAECELLKKGGADVVVSPPRTATWLFED